MKAKKVLIPTKGTLMPRLTSSQLELLKDIFRFRFVYAQGMARLYGQTQYASMHTRLETLRALGVVDRHFEGAYRFSSRPADYYVTKRALPYLKAEGSYIQAALNRVYVNRQASDEFIAHSLRLLDTVTFIEQLGTSTTQLLSRGELTEDIRESLEGLLPDLYGYPLDASKQTLVFLDFYETTVPIGVHAKKIWRYARTIDDLEVMPEQVAVLMVCDSDKLRAALIRRVKSIRSRTEMESPFYVTTLDELARPTGEGQDKRWWNVDTQRRADPLSMN